MNEQRIGEGNHPESINDAEKESHSDAIEFVNEKPEKLEPNIIKEEISQVPNKHIIGACVGGDNRARYYTNRNQPGYGQTPYYQQQTVGGQPVYVQVTINSKITLSTFV